MPPEDFDYETKAYLGITNDTLETVHGKVRACLRNSFSEVLEEYTYDVVIEPLSAIKLEEVDFHKTDVLENYYSYELAVDGNVVSDGTVLFTAPKHYHFKNPELSVTVEGDEIVVRSKAYAKSVEIYSMDSDFILSDNFFDMNKGEKRIKILEGNAKNLKVRSVYDIR
jgi:beta-mannosidase